MKCSFFHALIASVLVSVVAPSNTIGQAYQPNNSDESSQSSISLTTQIDPSFLAQIDEKAILDEIITVLLETVWTVLLILGIVLLSRNLWIFLFGKGIGTIILPFDDLLDASDLNKREEESDNGKHENGSKIGKVIADLLIFELCNIRRKYENLEAIDKFIIDKSKDLQAPLGEACVDASTLRKQILVGSPVLPQLKVGDSNVIENIGEVTTSVPVSATFSLDQFFRAVENIWPFNAKNKVIHGSIQKHGGTIKIIARMEHGTHTKAWQVISEKETLNLSLITKDLAFSIAKDLSRQPLSDEGFKGLLALLEDYSKFTHCDAVTKLTNICDKSTNFIDKYPTYEGVFGLLYNIGIAAFEDSDIKMAKKAEKVFRQAVSLEPYIINKVFDTKIAYRDVNWTRKFWMESFREYCAKTSWRHHFAYGFRSQIRRYFPNQDLRNEYKRIAMWANGLSYALMALGQTLEKIDANSNLDKLDDLSKEEQFVRLSQAEEAYKRADKRDRKEASALVLLSSLRIENVNIFKSHTQLKEGIIEGAQKDLEKAIKKTGYRHLAYNRLGNLFHDQGDYNRAIKFYKKAIKACPNFIVAYRNLGIAQGEVMRFDDAIDSFIRGMNFLPDDAVFQAHFCRNKWHAWLHNGIGWTYLIKYLATGDANEVSNGHDILNQAKYNFYEAFKISDGKMFVSSLNLGSVYALSKNKHEAQHYWKEGIKRLAESRYKDSDLGKLLAFAYEFLNLSKSKEDLDNLIVEIEKFTFDKYPPIRITNAALQDLIVIKYCLIAQKNQDSNNMIYLDRAIMFFEDYLPTLYSAISCVWKQDASRAVAIFQRKLPELYFEHDENQLPYSFFKTYLWLLLYSGLIKIFSPPGTVPMSYQGFKSYDSSHREKSLDGAVQLFNEKAQKYQIQELTLDTLDKFELAELSILIQELLERFNPIIRKRNENRDLFRQLLNDIHRKYEILNQRIGCFSEDGNYKKNIYLIFGPVEIFYQELEGKIIHDKITKNPTYSCFSPCIDYFVPNRDSEQGQNCYRPSHLIRPFIYRQTSFGE